MCYLYIQCIYYYTQYRKLCIIVFDIIFVIHIIEQSGCCWGHPDLLRTYVRYYAFGGSVKSRVIQHFTTLIRGYFTTLKRRICPVGQERHISHNQHIFTTTKINIKNPLNQSHNYHPINTKIWNYPGKNEKFTGKNVKYVLHLPGFSGI